MGAIQLRYIRQVSTFILFVPDDLATEMRILTESKNTYRRVS